MPEQRPLMRYQFLRGVLIGVLLLASPAAAGTYVFTWSEYSTGRIPRDGSPAQVSQTSGYGLITVTPSTEEPGAIEFTFSGPGGYEGAGHGFMFPSDATSDANGIVWYPNSRGEVSASASLKWFGDFTDPENFVILGHSDSQDGLRDFWGAATRVTASITTPKWGDTVAGIVGVRVDAGLANVPLVYDLGGGPIHVSGGTAVVSWDTRTELNGLHYLGFTVRHPTSGEVLSSTALPVIVNNSGPVKVFITQPHDGTPVSGTTWVVLWVEGTSGASNLFTLSTPYGVIGTQATSSRGPVSIPWNTKSLVNAPVTLKGVVRDATGQVANTSIVVTVKN